MLWFDGLRESEKSIGKRKHITVSDDSRSDSEDDLPKSAKRTPTVCAQLEEVAKYWLLCRRNMLAGSFL